ncbi:MAG TPA: mechanosensitive ion channel, partial [bacterium]|nr:mechanosensitive ion channel [bacterium]
PDNKKEIIPNSQVTAGNITNFSAVDKRRVDLVFSISYSDDIKAAREVLKNVVSADSRILREPEPVIAVSELGDSCVKLACRPWVRPQDYWDVYFETLEKGKIELEKNGMEIPFPQQDIHLYQGKK